METLGWVIILCILVFWLGLCFWTVKSVTKRRWQVVLKDGTKFIGKRTLGAMWQESLLESAYKVVDSLDSLFPEGTIVNLGWSTILYRIKVK